MYQDAKEELKRLEEALLQVEPEEADTEQDAEQALSDIPDLPQKDHRNKIIFGLTMAVIGLTAVIAGLVAYILIYHRGAFL